MEETRKVVEALMRVGPRFTDISKATGIPISTVRYILLKRLPKLGLLARAYVNYGALGLQRYLVEFRSKHIPSYVSRILDLLGEFMYLDYYTYSMTGKKFFAIFAVPLRFEKSFVEFLQALEFLGLMKDVEVKKLAYMKPLPFMTDFFDFSRGVWSQDWMDRMVSRDIQEIPEYPDPDVKIDKIDLMMLAELQKQAIPVKYERFAKKFGLSRQTISKHYRHARRFINMFFVVWFPPMNPELIVSPIIIKTTYGNQTRETIINIPFTYAEMKSDRGEYFAFLWTPSMGLYTTIKFLTKSVEIEELHFQSMECSGKFSIQYQLYKDGSWIDPFKESIHKLLEVVQKKERESLGNY